MDSDTFEKRMRRMAEVSLLNSTHNERIDTILREAIATFEAAWPRRIRSYYIQGSYADRSEVTSSDVDLLVVFKGCFEHEGERKKAEDVSRKCADRCAVELDIEIVDEQRMSSGISPTLKLGGLVIYGEDIRDRLSLVPLKVWTRDRMHSSLWRTVNLCNRPAVITYPLTYPDPTGEFYGYDRRKLRLPNGEEVPCTRDLIRLVGWSATAMLAFKAGRYVAHKSDCHKLYQECFVDEWGQLLQDIYTLCRVSWNYLIPTLHNEQQMLRSLCERTLGFENHFLLIYKEFLLSELRDADVEGKCFALWMLTRIVYQDKEIQAAVHMLEEDISAEVRNAVRKARQRF